MQQKIEKLMVFKDTVELPASYKFLKDYVPPAEKPLVVVKQDVVGAEIYLTVRYLKGVNHATSTHNSRLFRTVGAFQAQRKLLEAPHTKLTEKVLARL